MQVRSIAECSKGEHSAILLTFIKLPFVIKSFVLSIFEWPFYKDFTVYCKTLKFGGYFYLALLAVKTKVCKI